MRAALPVIHRSGRHKSVSDLGVRVFTVRTFSTGCSLSIRASASRLQDLVEMAGTGIAPF